METPIELDQLSTRISGIQTAVSYLYADLVTTHGGTQKADRAVRRLEKSIGKIENQLDRARQFAKKRLELV